jgi:Flp pilus assembly pilin Flp
MAEYGVILSVITAAILSALLLLSGNIVAAYEYISSLMVR